MDKLLYEEPFLNIIDWVLGWEGGLVDDPDDPGGVTKYGISQRAHPELDIRSLTIDQAKAIYYTDYWVKSGAGKLPVPLGACMFDAAVQHGPGRAKALLATSRGDWESYNLNRVDYYVDITSAKPVRRKYFFGWISRVASLNNKCRELEAKHGPNG